MHLLCHVENTFDKKYYERRISRLGARSRTRDGARLATGVHRRRQGQDHRCAGPCHQSALLDKAAFVAASRCARRTLVTACSERVDFKNAVHHGNLIELTAGIIATGRSSMTLQVELFAENLLSGER